ncbi:phosphotriesterase family protein [Poritiphilus flavus]|uniref:Phosphotriesterase n=1 Tax=Poritiphilus flavus TaxID=2697053 RepID=A0A6L9EJQ1_9FLAO|nr:phosphotriesterase [Poritiphilus flavus]NAS14429.1 phosphotriesterase [Poritiphilus flavus]
MGKLILFIITCFFILACTPKPEPAKLITVKGEIPVEAMGTSLIHEHVIVDWIGADSTGSHRWDRSEIVARALPFMMEAKSRGVNTFFDCTPAYLGRDAEVLKELAEKTGVNLVTNTGYYGARNNKFIPKQAFDATPEELARIWIDEFKYGIDGTGIFPGFMKISVGRSDTLSAFHTKLIKAAAIAHKNTGLTIVSHTGPDGPAFAQLKVLEDAGVSPEAFVWTHAQNGTSEGHIKAASLGAWISLDNVRYIASGPDQDQGNIDWYVDQLTALKKEKLLHKILISHDSGWYTVAEKNGGDFRDYNDIFDHLIPALKENGFTQEDIDVLLVKNPRKAYAIQVRTIK